MMKQSNVVLARRNEIYSADKIGQWARKVTSREAAAVSTANSIDLVNLHNDTFLQRPSVPPIISTTHLFVVK
jgi:hypothetical protein